MSILVQGREGGRENCCNLSWYVDWSIGWCRELNVLSKGSPLHSAQALAHPRWEDYNFERLPEDKGKGRFYWLGDGHTLADRDANGDSGFIRFPISSLSLT